MEIEEWAELELFVLKQLTWYYVINNSALTAQQFGQRNIIRYLFETFGNAVTENDHDLFPPRYREQVAELVEKGQEASKEDRIRIVTDLISGMT